MQTIDPPNLPATITVWHLHRGTVRFFIVGPGSTAMHPCSEPVYEGRHPTMTGEESRVACIALALLKHRHSQDNLAGVEEIKKALADAAAGVRPIHRHDLAPLITKRAQALVRQACEQAETDGIAPELCDAIASAVCTALGCSLAALHTTNRRDLVANSAKAMMAGILKATWPNLGNKILGAACGITGPTFAIRLDSHDRTKDDPTYQKTFRRILETIQTEAAA